MGFSWVPMAPRKKHPLVARRDASAKGWPEWPTTCNWKMAPENLGEEPHNPSTFDGSFDGLSSYSPLKMTIWMGKPCLPYIFRHAQIWILPRSIRIHLAQWALPGTRPAVLQCNGRWDFSGAPDCRTCDVGKAYTSWLIGFPTMGYHNPQ